MARQLLNNTKMRKTLYDTVFERDPNFEGQMINAIVNCLALEHGRFNEALVSLGVSLGIPGLGSAE